MRRARILELVLGALTVGGMVPASWAEETSEGYETHAAALATLYRELHAHPELSKNEAKTAEKMATELRALGFAVTTNVGGHGVVGLLQNGAGPTVMLRTDLDGLPIAEKTGLPFASAATGVDPGGKTVPTMHACGHDLHMASWVGAARLLTEQKAKWRGTLMMIAQPAEEIGAGARAMLKAGLFSKVRKPDFALALHAAPQLPSGTVGYTRGFALANVDEVDITVHGRGGHGAYPHKAVDPIVIAARLVTTLQTIVAREIDPIESAVVTVGSIHGGSKHNIIPGEVHLQITVRSYKDDIRKQLVAAIARIAKAESAAAGAPRAPDVVVSKEDVTNATYNDPALTDRVARSLRATVGEKNVREVPPSMGGEDFSEYGRAGVPAFIFWLGATPPKLHAAAEKSGKPVPSLHSPDFAPDYVPALRVGVRALTDAALGLFGGAR